MNEITSGLFADFVYTSDFCVTLAADVCSSETGSVDTAELVLSPFEMFVRTAHALARAMVSLGI
jgi:hypothetical protein